MDSIILKNVALSTRIGCSETERARLQTLHVTVEARHPTTHVAASDRLDEAIDYLEIAAILEHLAKAERWTIERLAEDIAEALLKQWTLDGGVRVTVTKHPPIPAESVSVTIERQ